MRPVSSSSPLSTGRAAWTASGAAPEVMLRAYHGASVAISVACTDVQPCLIPLHQPPLADCEGTAGACAGYCVRHGPLSSVLPQARGLRRQSSSWCTWLSHAPTPMPLPTPGRTSGISLGSRFPPLHCPWPASQGSRVHTRGRKQHAGGGVLLNATSPLWGSPVFLQGQIRLTWSPIRSHPREEAWVPAWHKQRLAGSTG